MYAGTQEHSFQEGSRSLLELADLEISRKEVERITKRIGRERMAERDAEIAAYRALPLVQKDSSPRSQIPAIAAVGADGGRYLRVPQEEDRSSRKDPSKSRWREFKAGCLLSLTGDQFEQDPCPDVPENLLNIAYVDQLARDIKSARAPEKGRTFGSEPDAGPEVSEVEASQASEAEGTRQAPARTKGPRPGAPTVLVRSVVASSAENRAFGAHLAAAAWERGFMTAPRKAFLGDGASGNWTVQKQFFPGWKPILDFIHLLTYIYSAALAGRSTEEGRVCYREWIALAWRGRRDELLSALEARATELGDPPAEAGSTDPRNILREALGYVRNNRSRIQYDEYRRLGLPITTSHLESTVKQLNRRIKGTEKHWSRNGGDALLQLKADYLSDTLPMQSFWTRRQRNASGFRSYSRAA